MNDTILFNKPLFLGTELEFLKKVAAGMKFCGDGGFTKKCNSWFEQASGTNPISLPKP